MAEAAGFRFRRTVVVAGLVGVVFAAAFLVVPGLVATGDELSALSGLGAGLIGGLLGLSLVNYALRALRWDVFSRAIDVRVPLAWGALFFVAGFAFTTTPGKVGEAVRLWLLRRRGHAYADTLPLMVGDRVSDALGLALLSLVGVTATAMYAGLAPAFAGVTVVAAVFVLGLTLLVFKPKALVGFLNFAYARTRLAPRLFVSLHAFLERLGSFGSKHVLAGTLVLAVVGWLAEASAFYVLVRALDLPVPFAQAIFIFSFSTLVGAASMLPGGLGGAEATMVLLLTSAGVDLPVSLAATGIIRLTTLWFAVVLGFVALPVAVRISRRGAKAPRVLSLPPEGEG